MNELDGNEMNDDAHAGASPASRARLGIREGARDLTDHLGPTLVAVLAGNQDPASQADGPGAGRPAPGRSAESRLRLAYRVWAVLSAVESSKMARMWFLGADPWLNEISQVEAITQMCTEEVLAPPGP